MLETNAIATNSIDAISIPKINRTEAKQLAQTELQRCLALLEQLSGSDWEQPTDCTEWNVKAMTAHLVGSCAGHASWREFRRQYVSNPYKQKGEDMIHGINRCQVTDRQDKSPQDIIAELRDVGPKAINTRYRIPSIIRAIRAPMPPLGVVSIAYLLDIIYPRDEWMHRADICRATGKTMVMTPEHDGRILDLVASDLAHSLKNKLHGTVELTLTGDLERTYRFGEQSEPFAQIRIDALEFNRCASLRCTSADAIQVSQISSDMTLATWFFENCEVGY